MTVCTVHVQPVTQPSALLATWLQTDLFSNMIIIIGSVPTIGQANYCHM